MSAKDAVLWEGVGNSPRPNWYLDPLVAEQKKREHLSLVQRWTQPLLAARIFKTDLFEEAFGADALLFELCPKRKVWGIDLALSTVMSAKHKSGAHDFHFGVADLRNLPFHPNSFDLILSTSSLDHFDSEHEFRTALMQLICVLAPGGRLVLTLDNIRNPLYHPLKWISHHARSPFPLGYAPGPGKLKRLMQDAGLEILGCDWLVHNPRMLSTMMFLGLRRVLGNKADAIIGFLLRVFSCLNKLPTRSFSACFVAVIGEKRALNHAPQ